MSNQNNTDVQEAPEVQIINLLDDAASEGAEDGGCCGGSCHA